MWNAQVRRCPCRRQPRATAIHVNPTRRRELPAGIAGGMTPAAAGMAGGWHGPRPASPRQAGAVPARWRRRQAAEQAEDGRAARDGSSPRTTPEPPPPSARTGCKSGASAATQRPGGRRTFFNPSIKAAPWQRQGQTVQVRRGAAQGLPSRRRKEAAVRRRPSQLPADRERPKERRHPARWPAGQWRPEARRQKIPTGQGPAVQWNPVARYAPRRQARRQASRESPRRG